MLRMAGVPALAGGKARWHAGMAQRMILALLGLALLSILILGGKGRPARMAAQSATETRYAIMFDAGSTASRVHVYELAVDANGGLDVVSELFEQVKPGLSAYADDPNGAAESLRPLLDAAKTAVPPKARACTPMALYATAGLRLLADHQVSAILSQVQSLLDSTSFTLVRDGVKIMDGKDEGLFAWMTVNFLLGHLQPNYRGETVGIMDLGGGSTQIVLEPREAAAVRALPSDYKASLVIDDKERVVYQQSFLGYGLMEARKAHAAQHKDHSGTVRSPCLTKGAQLADYTSAPDASFDTCLASVVAMLKTDQCPHAECSIASHPQPPSRMFPHMFAFSYFYDRAMDTPSISKLTLAVRDYADAARLHCDHATHESPHQCFDLTFMYALLRHGYKLQDNTALTLAKKIREFETGWCLGAAIALMQADEGRYC